MNFQVSSVYYAWLVVLMALGNSLRADEPATLDLNALDSATLRLRVRAAVERALPLLEKASAGSADQRTCFTCHSQAVPVFALAEALQHGFSVSGENLSRQVTHTYQFLLRGKTGYEEGRGQGGGVDTAGYALWTLDAAGRPGDEVTAAVAHWLLQKQDADGYWTNSSNRPPSEASNFATTYVALRAIGKFGTEQDREAVAKARDRATGWLHTAAVGDTEDQVFRLLAWHYSEVAAAAPAAAMKRLRDAQRKDGGWAQKAGMDSDAYATATVLYSLHQTKASSWDDEHWLRGVRYLLDTQLEDGSWFVKSRSKPFQAYFETGFPHGKDQFISTSATAWATLVLVLSLPQAFEANAPRAIDSNPQSSTAVQ